jgi:hypothetical protein
LSAMALRQSPLVSPETWGGTTTLDVNMGLEEMPRKPCGLLEQSVRGNAGLCRSR